MMKYVPCIMASLAALLTVAAIGAKIGGLETVMGAVPGGLLRLAMVFLLFGINHSLCRRCIEGK